MMLPPTKSRRFAWLIAVASWVPLLGLHFLLDPRRTQALGQDDTIVGWLALLPVGFGCSVVSMKITKRFVFARIACGVSVATYAFLMAVVAFMHWLFNLSGIQNPGPG